MILCNFLWKFDGKFHGFLSVEIPPFCLCKTFRGNSTESSTALILRNFLREFDGKFDRFVSGPLDTAPLTPFDGPTRPVSQPVTGYVKVVGKKVHIREHCLQQLQESLDEQ